MKLAVVVSLAGASVSSALVGPVVLPSQINKSLPTTSARACHRRDFVNGASIIVAGVLLQPELASAVDNNKAVDYSKVQDLLGRTSAGSDGGTAGAPDRYQSSAGAKRPMYLTEPTAEFKESEEKALAFKRKNLLEKQRFAAVLDSVATAANSETTLAGALDDLRRMVRGNKGLPIGVTKEEVVKVCRRRKSKKYWPTQVEIA